MSMNSLKRDLDMVTHAIHSIFVYAACTADGYVKVGISRTPFDRVYQIHCGSPSPVRAAQWVWIGSMNRGRRIEQEVRKAWDKRHTRGEWYFFDYTEPADKRDFHDTLTRIICDITGKVPDWNRLGPNDVSELIRAGDGLAQQKQGTRNAR